MTGRSVMRLFTLIPLLLASLIISGCGGHVSFAFISNPQTQPSSVSGLVVAIQVENAPGLAGPPVTVTAVTFSNGGLSNVVNFCGDQQGQFLLNQSVRADFNPPAPGIPCSALLQVVFL